MATASELFNQVFVKKAMFTGDHRTFELTVQQFSNVTGELVAVDITGGTLAFSVKDSLSSVTVIIAKSSAVIGQIDIVDPVNGRADINLVLADTATLGCGDYIFDVQLTTSTGRIHTLVRGTLTLETDVTP